MKEFIKNNKLSLKEGSRNATVTVLIGYSQHLEMSKSELKKSIASSIAKDKFIGEEIDRLWDYCDNKDYRSFWETTEAKEQYKF